MCAMHAHSVRAEDAKAPDNSCKKQWGIYKSDKTGDFSRFPICQEMRRLLNHPANKKHQMGCNSYNDALIIPKGFPNFRLPAWRDVPKDQWPKKEENTKKLLAKKTIERIFVMNEYELFSFKEAMIDIDHDGKKEHFFYGQARDVKRGFVRSGAYEDPNIPYAQQSGWSNYWSSDGCFPFYYKGRAYCYRINSVFEGHRRINPAHPNPTYDYGYGARHVCQFTPPDRLFEQSDDYKQHCNTLPQE